jgi:hypothetical protein
MKAGNGNNWALAAMADCGGMRKGSFVAGEADTQRSAAAVDATLSIAATTSAKLVT